MTFRKNTCVAYFFLGFVCAAPSAHANFFEDAWNVVTDPLKLDASTENIIHAVQRIDLLTRDMEKSLRESGATVDRNIRDYLGQVDLIIDRTFSRMTQSIEGALAGIQDVQFNVIKAADDVMRCRVAVSADEANDLIVRALNSIGATKPRFVLFGWEIGSVEFTKQDIPSPIEGYEILVGQLQTRLDGLEEGSAAKFVEYAYGEMQRVTERTRCHYNSPNPLHARLLRDQYEYRRKHLAWAGVVE